MRKRTFSFRIRAVLVVFVALSAFAWQAQANILGDLRQSIANLWSRKSDKQQSAHTARIQAAQIGARANALHDQLEATQQELQGTTENYHRAWRQMRRTEAHIVETRHRVHIVTERYNRRRILFGRRLAAMQRSGPVGALQIFLGSDSLSDLTRRAYLFNALTSRDAELQSGLKADREELASAQTSLMSEWQKRNRLQKRANRERERIVSTEQAQSDLLRRINNSRAERLAYAAVEEQSSREIEGMIGNLSSRRDSIIAAYEAQAAQERAAQRASRQAATVRERMVFMDEQRPRLTRRYARRRVARRVSRVRYRRASSGELKPMAVSEIVYHDEMVPLDDGHSAGDGHDHGDDGGWGMPLKGRMSSRFGMRFHPILRRRKMHTGDDLAAPNGTAFKAAHGGRVLWAGWKKAYGNTIIVDDGKGVTTLYGHASKLGVKAGQPVKKGEYIGNVGSTGWSTGPHLHFEVRKNGKPIDPTPYLRGR